MKKTGHLAAQRYMTQQERKPKNKAHFVVGLKVEVHHAAQHGGEVMRRTLVQLERLMLSQTSEAVVRAHANKTKNKQCSLC